MALLRFLGGCLQEPSKNRIDPGRPASPLRETDHYLKRELYSLVRTDSSIFEFLQAGSLDGIWYWDIEDPGQEWMSPRLKEVLGYQDHEVPNLSSWWQQNIFPEDLSIALENFRKHCADPAHPYDQVVRYRHKNGSTVWIRCRGMAIRNGAGKPTRMLGAHTDVSAMKRAEERLRSVYDASPSMYLEADLETGAIVQCNHALLEALGQTQLSGVPLLQLCDPESIPALRKLLADLSGESITADIQLNLRRADGGYVPILLTAGEGRDPETSRRILRAWGRDVSHLKRFASIEILIAALPVAILLASKRGVISAVNPVAAQIFDYQPGELVGRTLASLLAQSFDPGPLQDPAGGDLRGVRKDGSVFSMHGKLTTLRLVEGDYFVLSLVDLSSRESVERELRESEFRFRQLTESLPQLVWTCTPDGACDYLSPQWVAYTGQAEAEQLNLGWIAHIHPDDRSAMFAAWTACVRLEKPFQFDYRLRRRDGQYRWFDARAIPMRNVLGRTVKWFGSSTDVHEARETRAALAREQRWLGNLVTLAPAVFCSYALRPDGTAHFPYASPGILDLYGIGPERLREDAAHLFPLIHPDDRELFFSSVELSARSGTIWNTQYRILHPAKGERWIEGHAAPAPGEDGSIVWHGFLTDITDRKTLEVDQRFLLELGAALQMANEPQAIVELATQMVATHFDLSRCSVCSIDTAANLAVCLHEHAVPAESAVPRGTSYPLTMWGSEHWLGVLASGTSVAVADTASDPITEPFYRNAFQPLGIASLIAVPLRRRGQWVAVLALSAPVPRRWTKRQINLARVAAERIWPAYDSASSLAAERAMHETLAAGEERLRVTLQSSAIGIWERDLQNEEINWDPRCLEIFGLADTKIDRLETINCIHPEDRDSVTKTTAAYLDPAGSGHFAMEFRIYTFDQGALRYVYSQGQAFFTGEGAARRAVRAVGTMQDITALKQNERALRLANKELEEFAYAASHDLKGPLRVIDNASRWIEEDLSGQLNAQTNEHLTLLRRRVQRMEKLLDDLLDYARIGRATDGRYAETLPGNVLVEDALALIPLGGFRVQVGAKFATLTLPRMPLQQIFMNLIGNAVKHHDKKDGSIEVSAEDEGSHWAFAVKDDGPGIPKRFHEIIFKMFQTLRPRDQVEGSGMGLALVRKNIEVYGGTLKLESGEGRGSTFRFTWPKNAGAAGKQQ